jgi:CheY-like chemotaxis protein
LWHGVTLWLIFEAPVMMVLENSVVPAVVLVVEDEMLLRMRAVDMVEDAGYTPVEAVDADQAVAILESRSDIALLLTDIQMPGSMDGLGLAHSVHERWPPIRIIVVSGQLKAANIDIPADSRFFGKPFEAGEMIAEMRDMIGQARNRH